MSLNTKALQYRYQTKTRQDYRDILEPVFMAIYALLARNTDSTGTIALTSLSRLTAQVETLIRPIFVSSGLRSPFSRMIYENLESVRREVRDSHRAFYQEKLNSDLASWLSRSTEGQFEDVNTWRSDKGYDLDTRIIALSAVFLMKLNRYLTTSIVNGTTTSAIQSDLSRLSNVNRRSPLPTNLAGLDLASDVNRFLRNEVTRVYTDTVFTLAAVNTLSIGIEWALSPRHPRRDVCDGLATIGVSGERLRTPYPIDIAPRVVSDSHINCICSNYSSNEIDPNEVERLDALRLSGSPPPVSPLSQGFN